MIVFFCGEDGGFYPGAPYGDAVGKDCVELSDEQYQALMREIEQGKEVSVVDGWPVAVSRALPPPPSDEELAAAERVWRDQRLSETDGVVTRHRDELEEGVEPALTAAQYTELQAYRRQLRNWPEAGEFPLVDHRPVAPPWLAEQAQ